jgi:galactokinase
LLSASDATPLELARPLPLADQISGWGAYVAGVVWALEQVGCPVPGADLYYHATLPIGAGLSSSAALEVVTALALTELAGTPMPPPVLAQVAHRAETAFVGVPCGIMDQYAVALAQPQHVLSLAAGPQTYELVPVAAAPGVLVIAHSQTPHQLVTSPYATRRAECDAILQQLRAAGWQLPYLAALTPADYPAAAAVLTSPVLRQRLHHVIWENDRARRAPELLRHGAWAEFGAWMRASHESLRDDFAVTGPELDTLAEAAWTVAGCLGCRMTGAGFGGATVALVVPAAVETYDAVVSAQYQRRFGRAPRFWVTPLGPGAHEVPREEWNA